MTDEKTLYRKLTNLLKTDTVFKEEINSFMLFHSKKFVAVAPTEEKKKLAASLIDNIISAQVFHGYSLMLNYIEIEETLITEVEPLFWHRKLGATYNAIGSDLQAIFGEDWAFHKMLQDEINLIMLEELYECYEIYKTILLEAANYGAYNALIKYPKFKQNLNDIVTQQDVSEVKLGNPHDLNFISPQAYMTLTNFSDQHELWDVFSLNNGQKESEWVGMVHFSSIKNVINGSNEVTHILSITLSNLIREDEQHTILQQLYGELTESIKDSIQLRIISASNFDLGYVKSDEVNAKDK